MKKQFRICLGLLLAVALPRAADSQQLQSPPAPQPKYVATAAIGFNTIGLPGVPVQARLKQFSVEAGVGRMLNIKGSLLATLHAGYGNTRYNGTKTYATANAEYAPAIYKNLRGSISLGAGLAANTSPSDSWEVDSEGDWATSRNIKLTPVVASSIGLKYKINNLLAPTLRYQLLIEGNYNKSIPLLPTSIIQFGNQFSF